MNEKKENEPWFILYPAYNAIGDSSTNFNVVWNSNYQDLSAWKDSDKTAYVEMMSTEIKSQYEAAGLELLSCDIRKRAALDKGFEGAITDLQMKSFLIMSGFQQKRNRHGERYGWLVAALTTPETKWNYESVNNCRETPEVSWNRICAQIRKFYPAAGEKEIQKVLGIRK